MPHLCPTWGTWGTSLKVGHKWGTHLNFFKPVSSHQSGSAAMAPPGTDGRPRAGGRLPDGQGGRERATATKGYNY